MNHSPAATRRVPRAFTIVELLVVMSIILLLVSILLPSMKHARLVTRATICGSNTHQLAVSTTSYAADHFSMLMPHDKPGSSRPYFVNGSGMNDVYALSWASRITGVGVDDKGLPKRPYNWGYLFWSKAQYVPSGKAFYCPGDPRDPQYIYDAYEHPWGTSRVGHSDWTRVSYMYNVQTEVVKHDGLQMTTKNLHGLRGGKAFSVCYLTSGSRKHHTELRGVTVLWGDMSSDFKTTDETKYAAASKNGNDMNDFPNKIKTLEHEW